MLLAGQDSSDDDSPLFEDDGFDLYDPLEAWDEEPPTAVALSQPLPPSDESQPIPSSDESQVASQPLLPSDELPVASLPLVYIADDPWPLPPSDNPTSILPLDPSEVEFEPLDRLDTVSVASRRQAIIPVREKKRPRKPSPPRARRPPSEEQLDKFLSKGCGCSRSCYLQFERGYYITMREEANAMNKDHLDMFVKGQIVANTSFSDIVGPSHHHVATPRQRARATTFLHLGKRVCRETFLILHGIGKQEWLTAHYLHNHSDLCTF